MTGDNWFTDSERERLCLNDQCEEHGEGTQSCDIPDERPDNLFESEPQSISLSDAEPLTPEVEVVRSGEQ